jgi:hypothetical protein
MTSTLKSTFEEVFGTKTKIKTPQVMNSMLYIHYRKMFKDDELHGVLAQLDKLYETAVTVETDRKGKKASICLET